MGIETHLSEYMNLGARESLVYVSATKTRDASIADLARLSGISRTSLYVPLAHLVDRGFVLKTKIGKRVKYNAVDPKIITKLYERKKIDLDVLVQELSRTFALTQRPASVEFFSGVSGTEAALELFLENTQSKMWKTFESASNMPAASTAVFEDYIQRRIKRGIYCRCILSIGALTPWINERIECDAQELRTNILVSEKSFPLHAIAAVTDGMVCFISTSTPPYAVLIKSTEIADTLSTVHDMLWAQKQKRN